MNVKKIKLADIDPQTEGHIRPINESYAGILAESFKERGQDTAIEVRYGSGKEGVPKYILVAGGHRFRAAELAEWTDINASISKLNADEARLKKIDENLLRQELDVLSRVRSLYERKELCLKLHPETQHGGMRKADQVATVATCSIPRFAVDAAVRMGVSERTVHAETVKALQDATLADDRAELLYIGKIESPIKQVSIVKKALGAEKKPSELAVAPTPIPTDAMWLELGKKKSARVLRLDLPARRVLLDELVKAKVITRDQIVMEGAA
ncbi:ParB N-terminal domain-containing protein [Komagataeibacter europaeus]|uniref:ParB N-terminal domain-containing protein n=1 Tax=Komagataeibacter europaeus TaxID=33995 RepID=UPI0015FB8EEC|nr:ParB N-terminal domain-containing protein [Komagataeibacter europaeus]